MAYYRDSFTCLPFTGSYNEKKSEWGRIFSYDHERMIPESQQMNKLLFFLKQKIMLY
jgi:hypothetical protein